MSDVLERIGNGKRATAEEIAEWSEKLFTVAASLLVYGEGSSKAGKKFFDKQMEMLEVLDMTMCNSLPLCNQELKVRSGEARTPVEIATRVKDTFITIVAATVYCPAWKVAWAQSYVQLILAAYRSCGMLRAFAVEGGDECKQEMRFIEEVMHVLGFETLAFRKVDGKCTRWVWSIKRPGSHKAFFLNLDQFKSVDDVDEAKIAFALRAHNAEQFAPDLRQCAVVSCPLHGPDGKGGFTKPVHDALNEKLLQSITASIAYAEDKGFCTEDGLIMGPEEFRPFVR